MTETIRTARLARKAHRCWLCGGEIHPGTDYLSARTFVDSSVWNHAEHTWCSTAAHGPLRWWAHDDSVGEEPGEFRAALVDQGVTTAEDLDRWCEHGPPPCGDGDACATGAEAATENGR